MRDDHAESSRWERFQELWEAVERLPETERQSFVDAAGADNDALRRQLQALLSSADQAPSFFGRFAQVVDEAANEAAQETSNDNQPFDTAAPDGAATAERAGEDALRGQRVGHYRIEARLGEGGMGVVYRALDTRLQRTVALKFLPTDLNNDRLAKERFLIEARAAAALDHPNICTVHEVGEAEGRSFIAMSFYKGETLKQTLERGPVPWRLALEYATEIARGLASAHERGIIHRDVKPANVLVTADRMVKLLDFGIARLPDVTSTRPGHTPGTLAYMSPEQVTSGPVDHRSDLWSLGCCSMSCAAACGRSGVGAKRDCWLDPARPTWPTFGATAGRFSRGRSHRRSFASEGPDRALPACL
jgi:serine/threonine protein kinase